ncbi:MAG: hypothetical protein FWD87_04930 [Spirochaetaceae bacterium]|nr:hypothetical protein [Spirochaetaceae bacterium]
MKKAIIALGLIMFVCGLVGAQANRGGTMFVATRTVDLKAGTGFFARTNATLNYGDAVTVLQVSGKWIEVRSALNPSLNGWTATANLTARQIVPSSGTTATTREVALAGKGFDREVENTYRQTRGGLNYADVDKIEAITVNEAALLRFLQEGRLQIGD